MRQSECATLKLKPQIPTTNKRKNKRITFKLQVFCDVIQQLRVFGCVAYNTQVRCFVATQQKNRCCAAINNNKKI